MPTDNTYWIDMKQNKEIHREQTKSNSTRSEYLFVSTFENIDAHYGEVPEVPENAKS